MPARGSAGPLVSIVLPTHNGRDHLADSIESCLAQTYRDLELLLVDDASTDETPSIIASYARRDARIRPVRNPTTLKVPASLNRGFAAARGELLTWTSDDNCYAPEALATLVAHLDAHPDVDIAFSDYTRIDEHGRPLPERPGGTGIGDIDKLPLTDTVGACFLYRRAVHDALGGYDEDLFLVEDYDFWLRAAAAGFRYAFIDRSLYFYRVHEGSLTTRRSAQIHHALERCLTRDLPPLSSRMDAAVRARAFGALVDLALERGDRPAAARHVLLAVLRGRVAPAALGAGRLASVFEPGPLREWRLRRRLRRLARRVFDLVPSGRDVVLLDDGRWGAHRFRTRSRRVIPLAHPDGITPTGETTLDALRRIASSAPVLVVGAPAFWRLDASPPLVEYLHRHARCLSSDERMRIYDLEPDGGGAASSGRPFKGSAVCAPESPDRRVGTDGASAHWVEPAARNRRQP